jgi:pimeloyl-ACP methyl ester carboxylesterase
MPENRRRACRNNGLTQVSAFAHRPNRDRVTPVKGLRKQGGTAVKIRHVAAGATLAAAAISITHAETPAPRALAGHGYFFVGGQYVENGGKRLMAGQMYVEYMTPEKVTHPWPVVMIHGTAQTGSNFTGTPDGRPGWADNFVARGWRVYVVDQVGRARSGADPQVYGP